MWRIFLCLTLTAIGLSSCEELCYGSKYNLPSPFLPPVYNLTITYTPKVGEPKIVVNNGLSLDQRFEVLQDGISMADLTEQDNEAVLSTESPVYSVKLLIKNCGSVVMKLYWSSVVWDVPNGTEYLEFSKYTGSDVPALPTTLWNNTDSSKSRGKVRSSGFEIKNLTQQDSGYYRFRGSVDQLLKWEQILVQEYTIKHTYERGNLIIIEFPVGIVPSLFLFSQKGTDAFIELKSTNRIDITDQYLAIHESTNDDAGTYDCVDVEGNLILRAVIEIKEEDDPPAHWFLYVAISVFFVAFAVLGGKFCWNKYKNKKRAAAETDPVPPVKFLRFTKPAASDPTSV